MIIANSESSLSPTPSQSLLSVVSQSASDSNAMTAGCSFFINAKACSVFSRVFVSHQMTVGVQSSRMYATSSGVDMKSMGTSVAWMFQMEYIAKTHSGELAPMMAMRSPRLLNCDIFSPVRRTMPMSCP